MRTHEVARPTGSSPSPFLVFVRAAASAVSRALWSAAEAAQSWYDRWQQRQALMRLDDHLLKDIGVSRADADMEGTKPFWKG